MGLNETVLAPLGGGVCPHLVGVLTEKVPLNVGLYDMFFGLVANAPHLPRVGRGEGGGFQ